MNIPALKPQTSNLKPMLGFTLLEVVVSVALFSLIAAGLIVLVSQILSQTNIQSGFLADSDQSRKLSFKIMQELRNSAQSSTGAYALDTAFAQQLIFYSNIDGGTDIERIRYFLQNGQLVRGVVKPSGNPLTYNTAAETTAIIQNNVANGNTPLFYYYDGNYSGTSDTYLTQPVNVSQVTFVKLNLQVFHKGTASGTASYTITAAASIRNLKTNLGQ